MSIKPRSKGDDVLKYELIIMLMVLNFAKLQLLIWMLSAVQVCGSVRGYQKGSTDSIEA